jgi:hypothetical protein
MGSIWRYRVVKDEEAGKLRFVAARYRSEAPTDRRGLAGILNAGDDIEDMRRLARQLLAACDEPVIPMEAEGDEGGDEAEEEDREEEYEEDDRWSDDDGA